MVREATPIRVLLWMPNGMQREVVMAALRKGERIVILDAAPDRGDLQLNRDQLRRIVSQARPDVVVLPAPSEALERLIDGLGSVPTVFLSADGRSAMAYDGDVTGSALLRLVLSVVPADQKSAVGHRGSDVN